MSRRSPDPKEPVTLKLPASVVAAYKQRDGSGWRAAMAQAVEMSRPGGVVVTSNSDGHQAEAVSVVTPGEPYTSEPARPKRPEPDPLAAIPPKGRNRPKRLKGFDMKGKEIWE